MQSLLFDPLPILTHIPHKQLISTPIRRRILIRLPKHFLNPSQNLLHSNRRPPARLLTENGEANHTGRVDIRVEEIGRELANRGGRRVVFGEVESDRVMAAFPIGVGWTGDSAVPEKEIGGFRLGGEAVGVALPP